MLTVQNEPFLFWPEMMTEVQPEDTSQTNGRDSENTLEDKY